MMETGHQFSRKELQYARLMSRSAYEKLNPEDKVVVDGAIETKIIFIIDDTLDAKKNPFHLTRATFEKFLMTDPDDAKRVLDGGYIIIDELKTHRRVKPKKSVKNRECDVIDNGDVIIAGRTIPRLLIEENRLKSSNEPVFLTKDDVAYLLNHIPKEKIQSRFDSGKFKWLDGPA